MPSVIQVSVGDSHSTLHELTTVHLAATDEVVTLASSLREFHRFVEVAVRQCRNGGIDCKIHGLQVVGKKKGEDEDLAAVAFLASDAEDCCCTDEQFVSSTSSKGRTASTSTVGGGGEVTKKDATKVYVWGLNDKDQLGGLKGSKIKLPVFSETLAHLKPVHMAGGSKSLFVVTQEGRVFSCGEGTNGRLGLGHGNNVSLPRQVTALSQYVVKKVAVHSGGKHAMALTVDGRVFSWGEGDEGKLGHCSRLSSDKPRLIEALKSKRVRDVACGSSHSAAITSSGELYTWGCGEYGRLGHGDNITQLRPKQVRALAGQRVVQVACGSRDAQTLALTDDGLVYSWGDGDFGKLGRGGSEGCSVPQNVEKLNGAGICQIECGAQFSLALSRSGLVWTWGKGDYFRLGHGADQHVRKPTAVECLRGKKIVHVSVGALHCLAVTEAGQVFAWGDNDHGQQGNSTTTVNRKPALVHGLEGARISKVACGSSHSVAWTAPDAPLVNRHEPVLFAATKDPLGASFVVGNIASTTDAASSTGATANEAVDSNLGCGGGAASSNYGTSAVGGKKSCLRPSLSRVILSLETNSAKQQALQHVLAGLQILCAREAVVAALAPHGGGPKVSADPDEVAAAGADEEVKETSSSNVASAPPPPPPPPAMAMIPLAIPESPSDTNDSSEPEMSESISGDGGGGGGEAPASVHDVVGGAAGPLSTETTPDSEEAVVAAPATTAMATTTSARSYDGSLPHGIQPSFVLDPKAVASEKEEADERKDDQYRQQQQQQQQQQHRLAVAPLDDFTRLLIPDDARLLIDVLKLAVSGRSISRGARECLSSALSSLGASHPAIGDMLLELCVTELEDVTTDTERAKSVPQPVTQESAHPYAGTSKGEVISNFNHG